MPSRVTAGPRLNGPATTGTSISIPYGAPLYGPVRYVVPLRKSGLDPDPAVTFAVPMALAGSHLPTFASASLHCATLGMAPTSPEGSVVLTYERYCSPSFRSMLTVKAVAAPALPVRGATPCAGANGTGEAHAPPEPFPSTVKLLAGSVAAVPVNGVRTALAVAVPHVSELANDPRASLRKLMVSFVNGCSGFLTNVATSWPVAGLGSTDPSTRTEIPYRFDSAST